MEGIGGLFYIPSVLSRTDRSHPSISAFILLTLLYSPLAIALECPDDMMSYWTLDDQSAPGKDAVGSSPDTTRGLAGSGTSTRSRDSSGANNRADSSSGEGSRVSRKAITCTHPS